MGIEQLSVKHFGCIQDVEVSLTPLHAFIGPNDSGKSTLLRAIRTISQSVSGTFDRNVTPFDPRNFLSEKTILTARLKDKIDYTISEYRNNRDDIRETLQMDGKEPVANSRGLQSYSFVKDDMQYSQLFGPLLGCRLVRLHPQMMGQAHNIFAPGEQLDFQSEFGHGLAGIYDAIRDRDVDDYIAIQAKVASLFDNVDKLQLKAVSKQNKVLQIRLKNGLEIPAEQMSEGLMYFLGFVALPYLEPVSILLVEEPENGLHPARIRDIMNVLRDVSKTTQVILATHSPLVVNELEPNEVSVVTRTLDQGTIVTPIQSTPRFDVRSKAYQLGELWLSYANGEDEGPLLRGEPRP